MKRLGRQVKRGAVTVTVIAPKTYHSFHGFTAETICSVLAVSSRQSPLRYVLPHARLMRAHAEHINLDRRQVTISFVGEDRTEHIPYDHLLIANGAYDVMETVPGMSAHGWSLKEPGGVLSTRNHLINMLERADSIQDEEEAQRLLTVVVGGGGFSGVNWRAIWRKCTGHGANIIGCWGVIPPKLCWCIPGTSSFRNYDRVSKNWRITVPVS
jgi:NADH dehydrogenase